MIFRCLCNSSNFLFKTQFKLLSTQDFEVFNMDDNMDALVNGLILSAESDVQMFTSFANAVKSGSDLDDVKELYDKQRSSLVGVRESCDELIGFTVNELIRNCREFKGRTHDSYGNNSDPVAKMIAATRREVNQRHYEEAGKVWRSTRQVYQAQKTILQHVLDSMDQSYDDSLTQYTGLDVFASTLQKINPIRVLYARAMK